MTGLLLATQKEAAWLIERLGATKLADRPIATYAFAPAGGRDGGEIVISGMGPAAAAAAAEYLIERRDVDVVVNVGICGAVSEDFEPGDLVQITGVVDGDAAAAGRPVTPVPCQAGPWAYLESTRLATVETPVFEPERRDAIAPYAAVVDMEGLAVAHACADCGVTLHMLKGVTDFADDGGKDAIQRNIASVSAALAEVVVAGLDRMGSPSGVLAMAMRFVKIEHTIFCIPLLLAGAWLGAGGVPGAWPLLWIVAAGVGARTLGMAMNRILDRDIDASNPRTADRELPAGRITPALAWCVAAGGLALYVGACAALGPLCLTLSPVPAAALGVYSLLKRFTNLCHFGIGLCLGMAPLAAFIAAGGTLDFSGEVLLLAIFAFFWISGFDIIYALMDIDFDRQAGVHSMPASLGPVGAQIVAATAHAVALGALAWLWVLVGRGTISGIALAVAAAAFAAAYCQNIPVHKRFFPLSAIAGIAGSLVPLLGGLP